MSVSVKQPLTAAPGSGPLPLAITLRQSLASTAPPEPATVVYQLESWHNICFNTDGNKTLTVTRTVTQAGAQPFVDAVTLVEGSTGDPDVDLLVIQQTITDPSGLPPLPSHCTVEITSSFE